MLDFVEIWTRRSLVDLLLHLLFGRRQAIRAAKSRIIFLVVEES